MTGTSHAGDYFIGLMSGTSMDGIDAALVEFQDRQCTIIASAKSSYPEKLRTELLSASREPANCTIDRTGQLDQWVGECFRDAVLSLLQAEDISPDQVVAIGSHGQTLRHQPRAKRPFTCQIGDPNVIAAGTNITTVADFRGRDIALGGEGAPLAPAFHHWLFSDGERDRAILNIGGIANVTMLPSAGAPVTGFDTGPGNTLMDSWIRRCRKEPFDNAGAWASGGKVSEPLLQAMLGDPYFAQRPPKSTGFEYFNGSWTKRHLAATDGTTNDQDVQSTLAELSARTIASSIVAIAPALGELLVCGGGIHNDDLMMRLKACLPGIEVRSTDRYGLHPDWVEAVAFAWLAKRTLEGAPGNLPEVTGASRASILGAIYPA